MLVAMAVRIKEDTTTLRDSSTASMFRLRRMQGRVERGNGFLIGGNDASAPKSPSLGNVDDEMLFLPMISAGSDGRVLRSEVLSKQAKEELVWRNRFFVLTQEGVFYYEDESAFKEGKDPRGKILFRDVLAISGRAADSAPTFMYVMLGKHHVFCMHKEEGHSYVMSCPSKDSRKGWVAAVNAAYENYASEQRKRVAVFQAARLAGDDAVSAIVSEMTRSNTGIDGIVIALLRHFEEDYLEQVATLRNFTTARKVLTAWRLLTKQRRAAAAHKS